jgi:hypothetical protein
MEEIIQELKSKPNQKEALKCAYDFLCCKYKGERLKTIMKIYELFYFDLEVLWKKSGFLHCTNINKILEHLLISSGHFKKSDIKKRWTLIWYLSPHQFLQIKVGEEWVNVDVWAANFGVPFGKYAHGFKELIK